MNYFLFKWVNYEGDIPNEVDQFYHDFCRNEKIGTKGERRDSKCTIFTEI